MVDYHIEKSDGVPPECYNENESVKTECAQYRYSKELHSKCFDSDGQFLVEECGGPDEKVPTMQESIPECYDDNAQFLVEKCGKVTIVWNEQGLINYLFEGDLNKIIENFENSSEEHQIEVNGKDGQTMINDIKEEIDGIEGQITQRTFAPGTTENGNDYGKDGNAGVVIDNGVDGNGGNLVPEVVTGNGGNGGDDGLFPEVVTGNGGNNGDDGFVPEVVTGGGSAGDDGLFPEVVTGGGEVD